MTTALYIFVACLAALFVIGLCIVARELIIGVPEVDENENIISSQEAETSELMPDEYICMN